MILIKQEIVHVGATPLAIDDLLGDHWRYMYADAVDAGPFEHAPVLVKGTLSPRYVRALFLIDGTSPFWNDPTTLARIPWASTLVDSTSVTPAQLAAIDALVTVNKVDFTDRKTLCQTIRRYFFTDEAAQPLTPLTRWSLNPRAVESVHQHGEFQADFDVDTRGTRPTLMALKQSLAQPADHVLTVSLATVAITGDLDCQIVINRVTTDAREHWGWTVDDDHRSFTVPTGAQAAHVQIQLVVHGKGNINIGFMTVRRSHGDFGQPVLGGKLLPATGDAEISYVFAPGDRKPPFNVIFADYGVSGNVAELPLAQSMGHPYLVVMDRSMGGGGFFHANGQLCASIATVIQRYMQQLNMQSDQVLMAGMSMGAYGALMVGSSIGPAAIVVGRPLINLGSIASTIRLGRPDTFPQGLDLLMQLTGSVTLGSATALNDKQWASLRAANFGDTALIAGYMSDDDFDPRGYQQLVELWREKFTNKPILHKQFVGRHLDNTGDLWHWWAFQLQRLQATVNAQG